MTKHYNMFVSFNDKTLQYVRVNDKTFTICSCHLMTKHYNMFVSFNDKTLQYVRVI